jgi:hypothetical protein
LDGQTQLLPVQRLPLTLQAWPQLPQFLGSLVVSVQLPLQRVVAGGMQPVPHA